MRHVVIEAQQLKLETWQRWLRRCPSIALLLSYQQGRQHRRL